MNQYQRIAYKANKRFQAMEQSTSCPALYCCDRISCRACPYDTVASNASKDKGSNHKGQNGGGTPEVSLAPRGEGVSTDEITKLDCPQCQGGGCPWCSGYGYVTS